jgi:hypothetical protein
MIAAVLSRQVGLRVYRFCLENVAQAETVLLLGLF